MYIFDAEIFFRPTGMQDTAASIISPLAYAVSVTALAIVALGFNLIRIF